MRASLSLHIRIIRDTVNAAVRNLTVGEVDKHLRIRCTVRCVTANRRYGIIPTCKRIAVFPFNRCFGRRCRFYNRCALIILFAGNNRFVVISENNCIFRQFFKQRCVNGVAADCTDFRRPTRKRVPFSCRRCALIFRNTTKRKRFFLQYTAVPILERYGMFAVCRYNECAFTRGKSQGITTRTDSNRLHFTIFINRVLTNGFSCKGKRKCLVVFYSRIVYCYECFVAVRIFHHADDMVTARTANRREGRSVACRKQILREQAFVFYFLVRLVLRICADSKETAVRATHNNALPIVILIQ